MRVAYITSLYPAVSHTFILNEVLAIRKLGVEVGTFSVRTAGSSDILGADAQAEALSTRSLLPLNKTAAVKALGWCLFNRLPALWDVFRKDVCASVGLKAKLKWTAYAVEGMVLARWLVAGRYEHLHCHFGNSGSNVARIAARIADVPFSVTCHGSELNDPFGFRLPEKVRASAFTACVSKFGRARLMHVCPRDDWEKLCVVRCGLKGVDVNPFPAASGDGPMMLCVGRLSAEKGHFVLLDAMERIQERMIPARLTIVGDGPLREELAARARLLPRPDAVRFTGSLSPDKVAEQFAACSLVVLASFSEGVPLVLMEAFSHGRPVVATRVGGIPELVEHRVSGLLVSPGDVDELAQAIEMLITDPGMSEEMGKKGALKVEQEFNENSSANLLKNMFEGTGAQA